MKLKFTIFGYEIWAFELEKPWSIHIDPGDWELEEFEEEDDPRMFGWGQNPLIEREEKIVWNGDEGEDFGFGSRGPNM